jgi:hypothetical protein
LASVGGPGDHSTELFKGLLVEFFFFQVVVDLLEGFREIQVVACDLQFEAYEVGLFQRVFGAEEDVFVEHFVVEYDF